MQSPQNRHVDALNTYLVSRDISPVRSQLQTSWEKASGRTKRYYTRKAGQAVAAVVQDMTPYETGPLFRALCSSDALRRQLSTDEDSEDGTIDVTLMEALAECYQAASRWESPNSFHHGRQGTLQKTPKVYPWSDKISLRRSQTTLLDVWKRRSSTIRNSIKDRRRFLADRTFHHLHNKLAHGTGSAIWRKIHYTKKQADHQGSKRNQNDDSREGGKTVPGLLRRD